MDYIITHFKSLRHRTKTTLREIIIVSSETKLLPFQYNILLVFWHVYVSYVLFDLCELQVCVFVLEVIELFYYLRQPRRRWKKVMTRNWELEGQKLKDINNTKNTRIYNDDTMNESRFAIVWICQHSFNIKS